MDTVVFFHGKPSSDDNTCKVSLDGFSKKVLTTFFKKEIVPFNDFMTVQIQSHDNKIYSVSTYYHKGRDYNNRGNGYFAVSIIMEGEVIADVSELYEYLHSDVYADLVCGKYRIISPDYRYLVHSFDFKNSEIKEIEADIVDKIGKMFRRVIDQSFCKCDSIAGLKYKNPLDTDASQFIKELKNNGIITISKYQPSKMEIEIKKQNEKIKSLEKEIVELKEEKDRLKKELKEERTHFQQEILERDSLNRAKKRDARDKYPDDSSNMEEHSDEVVKTEFDRSKESNQFKTFRLPDLVIIGLIIICSFISWNGCSQRGNEVVEPNASAIDTCENESYDTNSGIDDKSDTIQLIRNEDVAVSEDVNEGNNDNGSQGKNKVSKTSDGLPKIN